MYRHRKHPSSSPQSAPPITPPGVFISKEGYSPDPPPSLFPTHPGEKPETQVYHPNLDLEGNVCLNILREDWKPVLNINSITVGLLYLFLEPNADDPLNKGPSQSPPPLTLMIHDD